jgi:hypothetical protein
VDIELSGIGYQTLVPFPPLDPAGGTKKALITEPYMAFGGGLVPEGTVVKAPTPHKPQQGIIAGGGTIYSFNPNAANPTAMTSTMRLEAWGLRNPYGIGFDPFNPKLLFVSNNGADVRSECVPTSGPSSTVSTLCPPDMPDLVIRGSKPIDNDYDDVFVFQIRGNQGQDSQGNQDQDSQGNQDQDSKGKGGVERIPFFGHPDYFHDLSSRQPVPVTDPRFCPTETLPLPPKRTPVAVPAIRFFGSVSGQAEGPAGLCGNSGPARFGQYVRLLSQ